MTPGQSLPKSSSIVRRLHYILLMVALLLLAESLTSYLSGRQSMRELQRMNEINQLTGLANRSALNLISAREAMQKMVNRHGIEPEETEVFREGLRQAENELREGLEASAPFPNIHALFIDAFESFKKARDTIEGLADYSSGHPDPSREEISRRILLSRQFELEVIETLRKARIEMQSLSDVLFTNVYAGRFTPLAVSTAFSLFCFVVVALIALSVIRRLKTSIQHLLNITDHVAAGDLNVTVPFLKQDEIGRLGTAFDNMISSVRESQRNVDSSAQRVAHLQQITAEFSRALEPGEVADSVVSEGISLLGASGGAVFITESEGKITSVFTSKGYPPDWLEAWNRFDLHGQSPSARWINGLRPVFHETREATLSDFGNGRYAETPIGSSIVVPLSARGRLIGVLTFHFEEERGFTAQERTFVTTLGALASQAYYRSSLYEEAQKAIEIRDSFLSIAAHELKTPLTSLKLQVQLGEIQVDKTAGEAIPPEKLRKVFHVCHLQVDRINSLVDDLLDVGRIESGSIVYNFTQVDARNLIESVLDRFSDALQLKNVSLEVKGKEPVLLVCDTFRIEQVLINLLSNAVKYGQGKPVSIRLEGLAGKIRFSVRDEGMGIAEEKLELIFNRFERAISARNISGLGLGLYISRRIVGAHDGRIWAESEPGKGAEFFVELPSRMS